MVQKVRKTFYLPNWICQHIETEGKQYDGPGVIVAAAIHHFANLEVDQKKTILKNYRNSEINKFYSKSELSKVGSR